MDCGLTRYTPKVEYDYIKIMIMGLRVLDSLWPSRLGHALTPPPLPPVHDKREVESQLQGYPTGQSDSHAIEWVTSDVFQLPFTCNYHSQI
jgi:hypothetical protein